MKKIGIIGHFGGNKKFNDGQTVKTNELNKELKKNKNYDIAIVDTYYHKYQPFRFFINCIKLVYENDYIIVIVASNGARILIPLLAILKFFWKKHICYCVIGSWLDERIKKNRILKFFCKRIDKIFLETSELMKNLNNMDIDNVAIMYNFKAVNELKSKVKRQNRSFCIFSRIVKEKGIEDAMYAINRLNQEGVVCHLDIYGAIGKEYRQEFEQQLAIYSKSVSYCGIVKSEDSKKYLSKYFMLLFPTHYIKEGLPGTLIDAYFASTPVISSNWLSAEEFVPDDVGYRYEFANKEELYKTIKFCINSPSIVERKRLAAQKFAKNFLPEKAIKPLLEFLDSYEE